MTPTEPSSDLRQMASFMRQTFVALTAEGFTDMQALLIIGQMLSAGMQKPGDGS